MANKTIQRFATITLPNGAKKRIAARGKTEKEALQKLAKLKAEYEAGIRTINCNTTFKKWVDVWLETYKKPAVTPKHCKMIAVLLNRYFIDSIGHMPLNQITRIQLQGCINAMDGLSASYIKKAINYIKAVFAAAVEDDILLKSPAVKLTAPKGGKTERRSLTETEKELFLKVLPCHHYGTYFGIMYACGLRPGEARALTYDCINWHDRTINIKQAIESGSMRIKAPKSASGYRTIPMPLWYAQLLNKQPRNINGHVFVTEHGNIMTEQSHHRAWRSFKRQMDIMAGAKLYRNAIVESKLDPALTPYYLRHTYATELAEKGVDIKTAQYLLGHADIKITAQHYTHVTKKMLDSARDKIDNATTAQHIL